MDSMHPKRLGLTNCWRRWLRPPVGQRECRTDMQRSLWRLSGCRRRTNGRSGCYHTVFGWTTQGCWLLMGRCITPQEHSKDNTSRYKNEDEDSCGPNHTSVSIRTITRLVKPRAKEIRLMRMNERGGGKEGKIHLSFRSLPSFATILNLLQKSSPFSPRPGKRVSSELPRMITFRGIALPSENLTFIAHPSSGAGDFEGLMNAGMMGVTEGCKGCGVEGAGEAGIAYGERGWGWRGSNGLLIRDWGFWVGIRATGVALDSWQARLRVAIGAGYPGRGAAMEWGWWEPDCRLHNGWPETWEGVCVEGLSCSWLDNACEIGRCCSCSCCCTGEKLGRVGGTAAAANTACFEDKPLVRPGGLFGMRWISSSSSESESSILRSPMPRAPTPELRSGLGWTWSWLSSSPR